MGGLIPIIFVCLAAGVVAEDGCAIFPFEVNPHPLIFRAGTTNFIYPKWREHVLRFKSGEKVDFICPGRNIIVASSQLQESTLTVSCIEGTTFFINTTTKAKWNQFRCSNFPVKTIRATGNTCANNKGRELEVGFNAGNNKFIRSLLICFNWELQIAYYTYINQTASINQRIANTPRPPWVQGSGLYSIGTVTNLYLRTNQRATINQLLGLPRNSTKYIMNTSDYYLARGHITARSDGFYAAQQNATFYMQNVAPQWQTFNARSWSQIEINIRDYAEANGVDLQIWTGVHGILTLPHEETGRSTELFLFVNSTHKALPVPELYWKVAFDPIAQQGIALIGVNNPYASTYVPICKDVSASLSWFTCRSDQQRGFCYACSIPTFRKVVKVLPDFDVKGLLL